MNAIAHDNLSGNRKNYTGKSSELRFTVPLSQESMFRVTNMQWNYCVNRFSTYPPPVSSQTSNRTAVLSKHDQVNVSKASLILCLHERGFCGSTLQRLLHTFPEVKNLDEVCGSYWSLLPSPSTIQHACKISIKLFAKEAGELWRGTLRLTNNSFSLNLKHYENFLHTAVCGRYHT